MHKGLVVLLIALWACGDDGGTPNGTAADGGLAATFCEGYDQLALRVGCKVEADSCEVPPACESAGRAWLACVQRDRSQCYCEPSERNLNCEGSFKPDEGPARCITEYQAFDACMDE